MTEEESEKIKNELEKCRTEKEEYLNGWKRAKADYINYQKDEAKRFEEIAKFSNWDLTLDLLPVLDSFAALERSIGGEPRPNGKLGQDLGIAALGKESKIDKGVYMIWAQLENTLKKRGLEKIEVSAGGKFDPAFHEAISEAESDQPAGTILEELEHGYNLNGRVIRPAKVKLAKPKQTN